MQLGCGEKTSYAHRVTTFLGLDNVDAYYTAFQNYLQSYDTVARTVNKVLWYHAMQETQYVGECEIGYVHSTLASLRMYFNGLFLLFCLISGKHAHLRYYPYFGKPISLQHRMKINIAL